MKLVPGFHSIYFILCVCLAMAMINILLVFHSYDRTLFNNLIVFQVYLYILASLLSFCKNVELCRDKEDKDKKNFSKLVDSIKVGYKVWFGLRRYKIYPKFYMGI